VKITMVLADAATVSEGKLNLLGAGWTVTGPQPTASAIGLIVHVPWDETNRRHRLALRLVDADGAHVEVDQPDGSGQRIEVLAEFEVGRPPGVVPGTRLPMPLAVPIGPIPLIPGQRYVWELSVDGRSDEDWRLPFDVRPADLRLAS